VGANTLAKTDLSGDIPLGRKATHLGSAGSLYMKPELAETSATSINYLGQPPRMTEASSPGNLTGEWDVTARGGYFLKGINPIRPLTTHHMAWRNRVPPFCCSSTLRGTYAVGSGSPNGS